MNTTSTPQANRRRLGLVAVLGTFCLLSTCIMADDQSTKLPSRIDVAKTQTNSPLIQVAILLDTSGSMEGLVDQARIQIWNVVDQLSNASRKGQKSKLQISVFQYGSSAQPKSRGYTKRVLDFSDDLDEVSRALFSLRLKGGKEFCGEAIRQACDDLNWNPTAAYRAIFIAGNEAFDQGETTFASVLPRLSQQNILVNTIYCKWKKAKPTEPAQWSYAANFAAGSYAMIDHNKSVREPMTPFDDEFRKLNRRMNESFIWYGKDSKQHRSNQIAQDKNAQRMSNSTFAKRMSAKIGHLYKHVHSDLVDAIQHGQIDLKKMPVKKMPESLQKMSAENREKFVKSKIAERELVRREMATLIGKRQAWLNKKMSESIRATVGSNGAKLNTDSWGDAFASAIAEQLRDAGFSNTKVKFAKR